MLLLQLPIFLSLQLKHATLQPPQHDVFGFISPDTQQGVVTSGTGVWQNVTTCSNRVAEMGKL